MKPNKVVRSSRDYGSKVLASNPFLFHRFLETSGTNISDSSANGNNGTLQPTLPQLNQLTLLRANNNSKSILFASGYIRYSNSFAGTSAVTIECVFQTTNPTGGMVFCSNNPNAQNTDNIDKCLFVSSGKVGFFAYNGTEVLLKSSNNCNDGNPHIVTATVGSRGTELWVDKTLVATNTATSSQVYNPAYWHVGWARWFEFGGQDAYFNGYLENVVINHNQISQAEIILRHTHAGF
jgi:Concanavalin A-like lectin/glucanases superfamily